MKSLEVSEQEVFVVWFLRFWVGLFGTLLRTFKFDEFWNSIKINLNKKKTHEILFEILWQQVE
jgi:hypothetical protein